MQKFEMYRQKPEDRGRCNLCPSTDGLMVFDGWDYGPDPLDEPAAEVNLCTGCQAWAYRTLLAVSYAAEGDQGEA